MGRMREPGFISAVLLSAAAVVDGLEVSSGSGCHAVCRAGDTSTTTVDDIVCEDTQFSSTSQGLQFSRCLTCLQDSSHKSGSDADVYDYLYNLRYAFDVCLFSYPKTPVDGFLNTPCNIQDNCGALKDKLTSSLDPDSDDHYGYCEDDKQLGTNATYTGCLKCLQATASQNYYANFLIALQAGCQQQPDGGTPVGVNGSLFSTSSLVIADPADNPLNKPAGAGSTTLTSGAIVGIAAGGGLAVLGVAALMFMRHRRRKTGAAGIKIETPSPISPDGPRYIGYGGGGGGPSSKGGTSHQMSESISSFQERQQRLGHKRAYTADSPSSFNPYGDNAASGHGYPQYDPRAQQFSPTRIDTIPAHPAYIPRMPIPRIPDRTSHGMQQANATDPYASRPLATHHARSFSQPATYQPAVAGPPPPPVPPPAILVTSATMPIPPPPPPAPKPKARIPALILPSLSRAKGRKMYTPPTKTVAKMPDMPREPEEPTGGGVSITGPVSVLGPRFWDRPLAGGPVLATEAPPDFGRLRSQRPQTPQSRGGLYD